MRAHGFAYWPTPGSDHLALGPHGLFGLPTPSAELTFLSTYGYGVARRVVVLEAEVAVHRAQPRNEAYVDRLSPSQSEEYAQALTSEPGCAQPKGGAVQRLGLPDGGDLGDGFASALAKARASEEYRRWQHRVVRCMTKAGIDVPADDLHQVERPFLVRLLNLMGRSYKVTASGAVKYEFSATDAARVPQASLRLLRRDEMRAAAIERTCRTQAGNGAQHAVDVETAPLVQEFPEEVSLLRTALQRGH